MPAYKERAAGGMLSGTEAVAIRSGGRVMPNDSMRTVLVALGAGVGVALAKVGVAVVIGSATMAAEAAHSLADPANDLFLFVAQRRSGRPTSCPWAEQRPFS